MLGLCPPNQRTQQVDSLCNRSALGAGTIFPGQAVWPRTAPQIKLPTLNIADEHVPRFDCDDEAEFGAVGAGAELKGDDASTSLVRLYGFVYS